MHCPKCKSEVQADWIACPSCGEKMSNNQSCPKCNKEVQPNWLICPYCGQAIATLQAECGSAKNDRVTRIIHKDAKDFEEMRGCVEEDRLWDFFSSVTQEKVQVWKQAAEAGNADAEHLYGLYLLKSAYDKKPIDEPRLRDGFRKLLLRNTSMPCIELGMRISMVGTVPKRTLTRDWCGPVWLQKGVIVKPNSTLGIGTKVLRSTYPLPMRSMWPTPRLMTDVCKRTIGNT